MNARHSFALLMVAAGAATAGAQTPLDVGLRGGAQYASYSVDGGIDVTVSELALPVFLVVPFGTRFSLDIGTAYAMSRVAFESGGKEEISGLTDTQLRGNFAIGQDWIILTAGVNIPTGQSTVTQDKVRAASYIANELLAFPISSMGSGLGTTGGFAIARPFGDWNVGFGGSVRYTFEYEPYDIAGVDKIEYQPGTEFRTRLGLDHSFLGGRAAAGVTYSNFAQDKVGGGSVYGTGDRWVVQSGYNRSLWGADWYFSAWDVFRGEGIRAGAKAPWENVMAGAASAAFDVGGFRLEPNIEGRFQSSEGNYIGSLALAGIRARFTAGPLEMFPSVGFAYGALAEPGAAENAPVTGYRAAFTARYR